MRRDCERFLSLVAAAVFLTLQRADIESKLMIYVLLNEQQMILYRLRLTCPSDIVDEQGWHHDDSSLIVIFHNQGFFSIERIII